MLGVPMKRITTLLATLALLFLCVGTVQAEPRRTLPSKVDLAKSYKPAIVNGMPWYRGAKAVKLHNTRRGEEARPILFLRILGDFDGGT